MTNIKRKTNKNIIGIMQSVLILFLVVFVVMMMMQIGYLQGTARVINYAGLVRGATQREIKLEITGLPNKSRCEEILNNTEIICEATACMMFDLNNLKIVNDTKGHSAGDQLIFDFAQLIRKVIPEEDYVGRYGGDEFMAVIYNADRQKIELILKKLCTEIEQHNHDENMIAISYAHGWALSNEYENCTMQVLFDRADNYMYENKQLRKK